jgi:hypothetical protein
MKTITTTILGISMLAISSFAAQDAPKTPVTADSKATTALVKKHKKSVKATTAKATTAAKPVVAKSAAVTPSK